MIAATDNRLTPTFPYLRNGTKTHKDLMSAQLASTNLIESKGNTNEQNTKSATQRLQGVKLSETNYWIKYINLFAIYIYIYVFREVMNLTFVIPYYERRRNVTNFWIFAKGNDCKKIAR